MDLVNANAVAVMLPFPLDHPYDYVVPTARNLSIGEFVNVPFGPRKVTGVVWGRARGNLSPHKLRTVISVVSLPPLTNETIKFIEWVADYTLTPIGSVLKLLMSAPKAFTDPLARTGYIRSEILPDRMTDARKRVLDVCSSVKPMTMLELSRRAEVSDGVIRGLYKLGILTAIEMPIVYSPEKPNPDFNLVSLSNEQEKIASVFREKVASNEFSVSLLDGVTGAGKTEVYFDAIAESLRQGRQSLVLVPEIGLTAQWLERFNRRFGSYPTEWHSDLAASRRTRAWRAVVNGDASVIVGARSALFLPFKELGLLVIDEEHDSSYKQEEGVIYNARDMAVVRARIEKIPTILVSATPSLETITNAESGRYERAYIKDRHGGAQLPSINVVDLRLESPQRGKWIAETVVKEIKDALNSKTQALLFLNRRGYAPLTLCRSCGHRYECPNCKSWLVEHRYTHRLQCHHCGHTIAKPTSCIECGSNDSLAACGPGVERLAEEAHEHFKDSRIAIMSSDTLTSQSSAAELVKAMSDREIDILIGTQVVAKGHHFPNLTVVAVIDADIGLSGGDLRAAEHTYQLLHQVAGRAGRAQHKGRVFLQTHQPESQVIEALKSGERDEFYLHEASDRKMRGLPPFGRLVALVISGILEKEVESHAQNLVRAAPQMDEIEVLGPAPAPISILRGRFRYRLLVKAARDKNVQAYVRSWIGKVHHPNSVRLQIDVDPTSFL